VGRRPDAEGLGRGDLVGEGLVLLRVGEALLETVAIEIERLCQPSEEIGAERGLRLELSRSRVPLYRSRDEQRFI
jgi:hypothetical protein